MIRIMNSADTPKEEILARTLPTARVEAAVSDIIAEVRRDGDAALLRLTEKFDKAALSSLLVTPEEIADAYELHTADVIIETYRERQLSAADIPAVLVHSHGPFTWGKNAAASVENAAVLETVAQMAFQTELLSVAVKDGAPVMQEELLHKHFYRKHGANAYYGQKKADH